MKPNASIALASLFGVVAVFTTILFAAALRSRDEARASAAIWEKRYHEASSDAVDALLQLGDAQRASGKCEAERAQIPEVCAKLAEDNAWMIEHCINWPGVGRRGAGGGR
jgi:hypothetical protein